MENLAEIFRDALKEEGLNAEVKHWFEPSRMADNFKISKTINGEDESVVRSMTFHGDTSDEEVTQRIAYEAAEVARAFDDYLTERVEWGEKAVRFDMKEGYTIQCFRCGAEADLDDLPQRTPMMAETAVPNPTYNTIDSLSDLKIKMTLQAMLKDECDPMCPNSPHDWP